MHVLIVTLNGLWSDSLRMAVAALAEADQVLARDCSEARELAQVRRPDVVFLDDRLPATDVLCLVEEVGCLTPPVRQVVLTGWDTPTQGLTAVGAELIDAQCPPPAALFDALAQVVALAAHGPDVAARGGYRPSAPTNRWQSGTRPPGG